MAEVGSIYTVQLLSPKILIMFGNTVAMAMAH